MQSSSDSVWDQRAAGRADIRLLDPRPV